MQRELCMASIANHSGNNIQFICHLNVVARAGMGWYGFSLVRKLSSHGAAKFIVSVVFERLVCTFDSLVV